MPLLPEQFYRQFSIFRSFLLSALLSLHDGKPVDFPAGTLRSHNFLHHGDDAPHAHVHLCENVHPKHLPADTLHSRSFPHRDDGVFHDHGHAHSCKLRGCARDHVHNRSFREYARGHVHKRSFREYARDRVHSRNLRGCVHGYVHNHNLRGCVRDHVHNRSLRGCVHGHVHNHKLRGYVRGRVHSYKLRGYARDRVHNRKLHDVLYRCVLFFLFLLLICLPAGTLHSRSLPLSCFPDCSPSSHNSLQRILLVANVLHTLC